MIRRLLFLMLMLAAGLAVADSDSLYQLHIPLRAQSGQPIALDADRGHPVVISMFYGSCPAACPLLISSIQAYEKYLDEASRSRLRVLMVSFDPKRDTPDMLSGLAQLHRADPARWIFAAASERDARKLAAVLGIQYRQQPDGDFNHTVLITLLDPEGRVLFRTSKLFQDEAFKAALRQATAAP